MGYLRAELVNSQSANQVASHYKLRTQIVNINCARRYY